MVTEGDGYRALLCTYRPGVDRAWQRALAAEKPTAAEIADRAGA